MHVGVLGGSGLLGTVLTDVLIEKNISYVSTPRLQADITDDVKLRKWISAHAFTHVINCAAYTQVDLAEKEQDKAHAVNVEGVKNVARLSLEFDFKLMHISTDYVFDGLKSTPYLETDSCNPLNIYGKSKAKGEEALLKIQPKACIVRTSWLFGKSGKNFISSLLEWMKTKEELRVVFDQINRPTYARDLAEALVALKDCSGIFHFANQGELSRFQIAKDLLQQARLKKIPLKCQKIVPVSSEEFAMVAARPKYSVLDTNKVENFMKNPRVRGRMLWETIYAN